MICFNYHLKVKQKKKSVNNNLSIFYGETWFLTKVRV